MSLAGNVNDLATRVAQEIKAVRAEVGHVHESTVTDGNALPSAYLLGISSLELPEDRTGFPNWPNAGSAGTVLTIRSSSNKTVQYAEIGQFVIFRAGFTDNTWGDWYTLLDGYTWNTKGNLATGPLTVYGTPSILSVGANGTVLTADSSTLHGMSWKSLPQSGVPIITTPTDGNAVITAYPMGASILEIPSVRTGHPNWPYDGNPGRVLTLKTSATFATQIAEISEVMMFRTYYAEDTAWSVWNYTVTTSPWDGKGSLGVGFANGEGPTKLPIGANGTVLVADSNVFTGLKWGNPPGTEQATTTTAGISRFATNVESSAGTSTSIAISPSSLKYYIDNTATLPADRISNSTTIGQSLMTASSASFARSYIGAGTSNLEIGTSSTTAKRGDYQPAAANISDSTAIGRSVITATDAAAARTAIGAGTSSLVLGTTAGTALAGDYAPPAATELVAGVVELATAAETTTGTATNLAVHPAGLKVELDKKAPTSHSHTASQISDSTVTGRSLITATDAAAARTATGAAAASHTHGVADLTATGTRDATTFLRGDGTWAAPATVGTTADATTTTKGVIQLAGDLGGTAASPTVPGLAGKADASHTHTAANISDSTATGRSVLTAADAGAARTAIGAGTSNLVIGTTASTAKAGDYQPAAANISDSTATGRSVLTATDAAAARTAIGAGTSNLVIGTTATTAKAGDYQPTAANISDSTATGRSVITATDAAAARTAIGAGTSNLVIGTTSTTAKAGDYQPTAANISDSTATGRSVITATDAAAARTAIGAGTSNLALGTTGTTAAAGDHLHTGVYAPVSHTHTAANISDSTATGRSVITATDAAAARTAIGAGTSNLTIGTTGTTAAAGNDARLSDARTPTAHSHPASDLTATGTRDATTFLRGDNTWAAVTAPANMMTTDTAQTITAGVKTFRPNQLLMSNADGTLTAEPYSDVNAPLTLNISENAAATIPTPVSGQATLFTRDGTGLRMKNDAGVEGIIGAIGSDALVDGATIATNANAGNLFRVTVAGDRTFSAPTNPVDGQRIMYEITASGANRTVTFATGAAGAFAYGTDFTSIPVINNGTTTFVGAMYSSRSQRWHILAVGSGHA